MPGARGMQNYRAVRLTALGLLCDPKSNAMITRMSEYQYYEFQAIDRPLTEKERNKLREYSTRANITATSFTNHYEWGSFKGDPEEWMERYFDAFMYFANWGTRELKLRLPATLLNLDTAQQYCYGESACAREEDGKVILSLTGEDEDPGWGDDEPHLSGLLSIRSELASGDLRALYIGWLLSVQHDECDDDEMEPPVPPGLRELSAALHQLADFLCLDFDLLDVAAQTSAPLRHEELVHDRVQSWVANLASGEKNALLTRLMLEDSYTAVSELRQRYRKEHATGDGQSQADSRTAGELLKLAEARAKERQRMEAEERAREKERKEREAALAREKHLDSIAGREPALWKKIESLIATTQPNSYDTAINLLIDLRDLDQRSKQGIFPPRLQLLKQAHTNKPAFLKRLQKNGLSL